MTYHNIPPVFDKNSKILVLGSFPSVKSREVQFFYGHPQNRFWKVISLVFNCECPQTVEEKKRFLLLNNIALWDVIHSCDITGSSDSSVKNAVPNDLSQILKNSDVTRIFTNGTLSYNLYNKLCLDDTGIEATKLPSTSPANAAWSQERLVAEWKRLISQV
ncbi:MAG: DNA-deoxyinosine glycosylase [Ruminococcaceae bacterium]|nr:DNA-deoxyinosine glycosylase [Oscillospiraceae bacterium]